MQELRSTVSAVQIPKLTKCDGFSNQKLQIYITTVTDWNSLQCKVIFAFGAFTS